MILPVTWGEFLLNTTTAGVQTGVQLHALDNGRFLALWQSTSTNAAGEEVSAIYAQRFYSGAESQGAPVQVNTTTSGTHSAPVMQVLDNGNIAYVWEHRDMVDGVETFSLRMRILTADGTPVDTNGDEEGGTDDFVIASSTTGPLTTPQITLSADGRPVISYTAQNGAASGDPSVPTDHDVKAVIVGADYGLTEVQIEVAAGSQTNSSMIKLNYGNLVSIYNDTGAASGDTEEAVIKVFSLTGTTLSIVNEIRLTIKEGTHAQAAALSDSRFVVTWTVDADEDGDGVIDSVNVMAQVFEQDGSAADTAFIVNKITAGNQSSPSVTALAQGGFAISYLDGDGADAPKVRVAVFDENQVRVSEQDVIANSGTNYAGVRTAPKVIELADGRLIVAWNERIPGRNDDADGIRGQVIDARFKPINFGGTNGHDQVIGSAFDDTLTGGADGNDQILGRDGNDVLYGGTDADAGLGDDTLDGGVGADRMHGGVGNDTYHVDNIGDVVVELAGGGMDLVKTTISYTLSGHVENILAEGTNAINLTGNSLDNTITGNAAANVLKGGLGNDTYYADNLDTIIEEANGGTDRVITSFSHTLAAHVENLTAIGAAAVTLTGNELANTITGNSASNTINGGAGNDFMAGGQGDDTYYVDSADDHVSEAAGEGTDKIIVGFNYTLGDNVENLEVTGSGNLTLNGNSLNNHIKGNGGANVLNGGAGNDTLDGGSGADRMVGGADSDKYYVDNVKDVVVEDKGGGYYDEVVTTINYTLGANVEWGWIWNAKGLTLTGNSLNNHLNGNVGNDKLNGGAGNDTLVGGAGADTMTGGSGNDSYFVDNKKDKVIETAKGGKADMVTTGLKYTLGAHVEHLTGVGNSALSLTGNSLSNKIIGNDGKSTIKGLAGNDTIDGGYGNDVLYGGQGKDAFVFSTGFDKGSNVDTIKDFNVKDDTIHLDNAIFKSLPKNGKLSKSFFKIGPKAKDADDYIIYDNKKGILYYDADGSGAGAAIKIATLGKKLKMTAADFLVI